MPAVQKITREGEELFIINYTGLNEKEMMRVASEGKQQIQLHGKTVFVLAIFDDKTYVTPAFMRHSEKETKEVIHLTKNVAFVGLSSIKKMILRGYNLVMQRTYQAFDSEEEAIAHLLISVQKESSV
jgi:hypothetical protein